MEEKTTKKTTQKTTKKEATKKTETKESKETKVAESSTKVSEEVTKVVKRNVDFAPDYLVECRSVTSGTLLLEGRKTRQVYRWENDNDITLVEYQDVFAEVNRKSGYIFTPYFIIEDENVLNNSRFQKVKEFYQTLYETDIDKLLTLEGEEFRNALSTFSKGFLEAVKIKMATLIRSGELDSIQKVKDIDTICGSDLMSVLNDK